LDRALSARVKPEDNTVLLVPPAYQRAFPEAHAKLAALLEEITGLALLKKNSVAERSHLIMERAIENLPRLCDVPLVDLEARPLAGTPAFIVSAGPSLDRNRDLLAQASTRGAIFAVNTSAPVLAKAGVPIDLLCAIEAIDVSEPMRMAQSVTSAL